MVFFCEMVILVVFNSFNVVKNLKKPDRVAHQMPPFYTTDDNTSYNSDFSLDTAISNLEKSTNSVDWFTEKHMKANVHNYYLLLSTDENFTAKIENFSVEKNSTKEKLLG